MRVLVTGNQGYVGSAFTQLIRSERLEYSIVGIDTGFFPPRDDFAESTCTGSSFHQITADIRDVDHSFFTGVDAVVHLAAVSNDPMGNLDEGVTYDVNLTGTVALARIAKEAGVRHFVFASSCSVYGQSGAEFRSELDPPDPLTPYAKSKVLAERELALVADASFEVSCLRFSTAAGWSANLRSDLVVNDLTFGALRDGRLVLKSDGLAWRPIIDVSDMARAILWFLENALRSDPFLVVNIGSEDETYTILEIASRIATLIPGTQVEFATDSSSDGRSYRVSFERMKQLGDFRPRVTLAQTVLELVKRWDSILGVPPDDFVRLHALTELRNGNALDNQLRWVQRGI